MESPVSAGMLLPDANNRLSLPEGFAVSLPVGSACRLKVWLTAWLMLLLKAEACKLAGCEFLPADDVAVPVAGRLRVPRTVPAPLTSSVEAGVVVFKPTLAVLPVPL